MLQFIFHLSICTSHRAVECLPLRCSVVWSCLGLQWRLVACCLLCPWLSVQPLTTHLIPSFPNLQNRNNNSCSVSHTGTSRDASSAAMTLARCTSPLTYRVQQLTSKVPGDSGHQSHLPASSSPTVNPTEKQDHHPRVSNLETSLQASQGSNTGLSQAGAMILRLPPLPSPTAHTGMAVITNSQSKELVVNV